MAGALYWAVDVAVLACSALPLVARPLVTEVIDRRAEAYHGEALKDGVMAYTDRRFPLEDVPKALAGAVYLAFPNDYKTMREGGASFTLKRPATVSLCYDGRAEVLPPWIEEMGFERTDFSMTVGAAGAYPFHVYEKAFPAGRVVLGPNHDEEGAGGGCMYGVAIREKGSDTFSPPLVVGIGYHRGADFHGTRFEDGARVYTDRGFRLKDVPKALAGAVFIPTPQNARTRTTGGVSVSLSAKVAVYVAFTGPPPAWAAKMGLKKTDLHVTVTGLSRMPDFAMDLYRRSAGPGRLDLGPNAEPGAEPGAMYVVIVQGTAAQNRVGVRSGIPPVRPKPIRPDNPKIVWCDDADRWTATVWAGNPTLGPGFQQGPLLECSAPGGLLFGPDGMVFASYGSAIAVIHHGSVRLFAGLPGVAGHADGPVERALFGDIGGMVLHPKGGLVILDRGNLCIRRLRRDAKDRWLVETVAGVPGKQGRRDGPAGKALFNQPWNLAVDSKGRIYTFDGNFLRRVAEGQVKTLNPKGGPGWKDGPLAAARFSISPGGGCCIDEHDVLYLADRINRCIRRIDLAKGQVATVCGSPIQHKIGYTDGPAPLVAFHDSPGYILYDPVRACYYTNGVDEQCIRRLAGGWLKSLAGHGTKLTGPAKELNIKWPAVCGIDLKGDLYIRDSAHRGMIRKLACAPAKAEEEVNREGVGTPPGGVLTPLREVPSAPTASANRRSPAAAFGNGRFLVVAQSGFNGLGGRSDIVGCFTRDGALARWFPVCSRADVQERPTVAASKAGFLVAWQDCRNGRDADIYAARVSADGAAQDKAGIPVAVGPGTQCRPVVASDGSGFLVAWQSARGREAYAIHAVRLGADGKVLDKAPLALGTGRSPAVAFGGGKYLVVWDAGHGRRRPVVEGVLAPPTGKPGKVFSVMQVCTNCPSVAAGRTGFLVIASRKPVPNPWGWGGPSGFVAARVGFDGSTPDAEVTYAYYHKDLAARKQPNILDSSQWKRDPLTWPAGRVGGFPGTANDQWPHLYSAVAPRGDGFTAVWVRRRIRNRWRLTIADLLGASVSTDPWRIDTVGGTPVATTDDNESLPRLAAGDGRALLVYERVGSSGAIDIVAQVLDRLGTGEH